MMFDEKYAGKISPPDTTSMIYAAAAVLGYDMMNVPDDKLYGEVADLLRKQRDMTRMYWETATELDQAMASGEVVVAYANPKEGIWGWCCGVCRINSGDGDEQMVYDFIDAWISPEAGKYLIEGYGYGHSNMKSFEVADPAIVASLGLTNPEALMENSVFFGPLDPIMMDKYQKLWEDIRAGS